MHSHTVSLLIAYACIGLYNFWYAQFRGIKNVFMYCCIYYSGLCYKYICMYALFHPIHARSLKAALKITLRIWPTIEWNYPDGGKKNITQKFRTTTRKYNEVGCVSRNSIYVTQKKNYLKRDLFFCFVLCNARKVTRSADWRESRRYAKHANADESICFISSSIVSTRAREIDLCELVTFILFGYTHKSNQVLYFA